MKKTWKLGSVKGWAADIMRSAPSLTAAGRALGVDRQTVHRWVKKGKIPPPGGRRGGVGVPAVPAGWGASIRASYDLSSTEATLLELAEAALALARDVALKPADRLSAMARFGSLVKQINLEVSHGDVEAAPWPRQVG